MKFRNFIKIKKVYTKIKRYIWYLNDSKHYYKDILSIIKFKDLFHKSENILKL